mmetsp:Transcript_15374/g.21943  ORF Transcript_15374/g.21943 Transcript_15374/m.21943 type:complete len:901 (+) Transcript_15374:34-2736(+)
MVSFSKRKKAQANQKTTIGIEPLQNAYKSDAEADPFPIVINKRTPSLRQSGSNDTEDSTVKPNDTSSKSSLQVSIFSEPRETDFFDRNQDDSTAFTSYTGHTSTTGGSSETDLLRNVMSGIGINCGANELKSIPEESPMLSPPSWGVAPSFDSDSDSDSKSLMERSVHYENIEMILNDDILGRCDQNDEEDLGKAVDLTRSLSRVGGRSNRPVDLFCKPCDDAEEPHDSGEGKTLRNSVALKGSGDRNEIKEESNFSNSVSSSQQRPLKKTKSFVKFARTLKIKSKNKKGKKKKADENAEVKKVKRGKWKAVIDESSGKLYYYHTRTKEMTFERPITFVEWKATEDKNTGNIYFYNTITRKSTWDRPDGFREWRPVIDETSGKTYYYNMITKETSWVNPEDTIIPKEQEDEEEGKSNSEDLKENESVEDSVTNTQNDDAEIEQHDNMEDDIEDDIPTIKTRMNVLGMESNENNGRLASLLCRYCPDEAENNKLLLQKYHGKELPVIKKIESLIEHTPFDELRLAIFSYVKEMIEAIDSESEDDEATSKIQTPEKEPNFASYSVRRVETGFSAFTNATGRTNRTDTTSVINNTSSKQLNTQNSKASTLQQTESGDDSSNLSSPRRDFLVRTQPKVIIELESIAEKDGDNEESKDKVTQEDKHAIQSDDIDIPPTIPRTPLDNGRHCRTEKKHLENSDSDVESAYAGGSESDDGSYESDLDEWNDNDDTISALSDPFLPSYARNQRKLMTKNMNKTKIKRRSPPTKNKVVFGYPDTRNSNKLAYSNSLSQQQFRKQNDDYKRIYHANEDIALSQSYKSSITNNNNNQIQRTSQTIEHPSDQPQKRFGAKSQLQYESIDEYSSDDDDHDDYEDEFSLSSQSNDKAKEPPVVNSPSKYGYRHQV